MGLIDKKILVVEDDEIARDVLVLILKKHFRSVMMADNGEKGMAMVGEHQPDIVIADLAMPVMDGFAMIDRIKEVYPEIGILIVTAYREEANSHADYPILYKPVNRTELLDVIKKVLGLEEL